MIKISIKNQINLNELRKLQIEILDSVHKYCLKNNLEYFLSGGTLLGAVRHKGFIPWDDDIDIVLPREDYDFFIRNYKDNNSTFKVVSHLDEYYNYPFAKVYNNKTILIETHISQNYSIGVNIDLFPLDIIPDSTELQNKSIKKINLLRKILYIKNESLSKDRNFLKENILRIGKIVLKFYPTNKIIKKINDIAMQYRDSHTNHRGVLVWGYREKEILPKNTFKSIVGMDFEGNIYNAPNGYHEWLESLFGDYMMLPPKEQQVSHHDFVAFYKNKNEEGL